MKPGKAWITAAVLASLVLDGCGTQQMVKPTDNTTAPEAASKPAGTSQEIQGASGEARQNVARKASRSETSSRGKSTRTRRIKVVESSAVASGISGSATVSSKAGPGRGYLVVLGVLAVVAVAYALMRRKGPSGNFPPSGGSAGRGGAQMSAGAPQGGVGNTASQPGASTGPPGPPG
jgi:hypothetical protein